MCTVSFVPNRYGFYLAMNRDEKRSRETALPPSIVDLAACRAIFPREREGGTWIAANDASVCIALINWHRIKRKPRGLALTRAMVVETLAGKLSSEEIHSAIKKLPLRELRPFRLIAVVPSEQSVTQWRWDLRHLTTRKHLWEKQHWFSSGLDEGIAERERRRVCKQDRELDFSIAALRRLHRSHKPSRGAFSICMHRPDAATVSYTEVCATDKAVLMRYAEGPPCLAKLGITRKLLVV